MLRLGVLLTRVVAGEYPVLLAAMSDVAPEESGLASGVVNTSFMMGGALGLAVLASLAAARTDGRLGSGDDAVVALNGGYQVAFLVGAAFAFAAALLGGMRIRARTYEQAHGGEAAIADPAAASAE